jgi:hypothetical protein
MLIEWQDTLSVRFTRALYPDRKTSSDVVESRGTKQIFICLEAEGEGADPDVE